VKAAARRGNGKFGQGLAHRGFHRTGWPCCRAGV